MLIKQRTQRDQIGAGEYRLPLGIDRGVRQCQMCPRAGDDAVKQKHFVTLMLFAMLQRQPSACKLLTFDFSEQTIVSAI